ncbi:hypothetical protein A2U01_0054654, partial [Trifolium medium]|nr:hypothetical protein [Trifolium medium]
MEGVKSNKMEGARWDNDGRLKE